MKFANSLREEFVAPLVLIIAAMVAAPVMAGGHSTAGHSKSSSAMHNDIIDVAASAGQFTTLAAALNAAGLVETLRGDGPFTVFAPTDDAFAKLPAGTVEMLLLPENKDKLVAVLTYHVVPGEVTASQVVKLTSAATVNGDTVDIKVTDGTVLIDAAKVVKADVKASNGVIHVIDSVIMPN